MIAHWWRTRQTAARQRAAVAEEREARLRRISDMEAQRHALICKAQVLYRLSCQSTTAAHRDEYYALACAADTRAEALYWRIGGDDDYAAACIERAEEYERQAGAPRPVASKPGEAAHA